MKYEKCPGCGVGEGHLHEGGCDKEICPFCNCQLLFCGCWEEKLTALGFEIPEAKDDELEIELPPEWEQKWQDMLNAKGLIPFINYPVICAKCGQLHPDFFMLPDQIWKKYVQPNMRNEVLCKSCFDFIVAVTDSAQSNPDQRS